MMTSPLVSVVITTHQRELSMLYECLDSVMAQTYHPIEVIVVDDNPSAYAGKEALRSLPDRYAGLKLIQHKTNQGAQRSRNDGIDAAEGEFVAFLDDDDSWLPQKIEKQMPYFAQEDVGLVYCRGYLTHGGLTDHSEIDNKFFNPQCTHRSLLAFDDIGTTSQAIIRKACFAVVGHFDEMMPARQDYEMWLRISKAYRTVGCPDFLYVRRMHQRSGQISRSQQKAQEGALRIYEKYKAEYRKDRKIRALGYWQMGSHPLFEGTWFRRKYRLLALMTHPLIIWKRIHGRAGIIL